MPTHKPSDTLFANPKGGVGKSTLFDEVAWALENRGMSPTTYQLDHQASAYHDTHEHDGAEYILVDTPARPNTDVINAINDADLVVVPLGPSPRDLAPTTRIIHQIKAPTVVVLNEFSPTRKASQGLQDYAEQHGWHVLAHIPSAAAFTATPDPAVGVVQHSPSSRAAHAINSLTDQIIKATK